MLDNKQERLLEQIFRTFIRILEKSNTIIVEFDEELWNTVIEMVRANSQKEITFVFKDGFELQWNI